MTQYAIGTSFIAAPAISMLSSIVVRAYCHRVIRLSDVLPSLAPGREVTCNVHGVRSEFLDAPNEDNHHQEEEEDRNDHEQQQHARVYFIGKLIWAKGFDQVLEMQDLFREATGEYLAMDVSFLFVRK
jgi:digalactosyldiacylglycerol synthase